MLINEYAYLKNINLFLFIKAIVTYLLNLECTLFRWIIIK